MGRSMDIEQGSCKVTNPMKVDFSDHSQWDMSRLRDLAVLALESAVSRLQVDSTRMHLLRSESQYHYGSGHHHLVPEIFIQLQGYAIFHTPDDSLRLETGDVMLVPPGVVHDECGSDNSCNLVGKIIGRVFAYHVQQPNSVMRCINDTLHVGAMESPLPMLIDACQITDDKIRHHLISASFLSLARLLVLKKR